MSPLLLSSPLRWVVVLADIGGGLCGECPSLLSPSLLVVGGAPTAIAVGGSWYDGCPSCHCHHHWWWAVGALAAIAVVIGGGWCDGCHSLLSLSSLVVGSSCCCHHFPCGRWLPLLLLLLLCLWLPLLSWVMLMVVPHHCSCYGGRGQTNVCKK